MRRKEVALYMRAWIEVIGSVTFESAAYVALYMRAWIEVDGEVDVTSRGVRRPLHEGVD